MTKQCTVVLAEDDHFISLAYTASLKAAGFEVFAATDGDEALHSIQKHLPDIILLDVIMPFKTGFEVLEEIKKDQMLARIPVIMFSNLGQKEDIEKADALGAVDYINKDTVTMAEVIEKINIILQREKNKS